MQTFDVSPHTTSIPILLPTRGLVDQSIISLFQREQVTTAVPPVCFIVYAGVAVGPSIIAPFLSRVVTVT